MNESQIAALQTGRYRPMADAPKDGTAVMVLLNGSNIPLPARWRDQMSQMATGGNGWYVTWDNHKLSVHDGPRGWLPIPDAWLPEAQPAGSKLTLENAPIGTKAPAYTGGHWIKTAGGWKWCTGSTFPRPGGDWTGKLIPPENDCEDQGRSSVSDGCSKWPCNKEPLIRSGNGWVCTKCGGSY